MMGGAAAFQGCSAGSESVGDGSQALQQQSNESDDDAVDDDTGADKTLYVWVGDEARQRPNFIAVIDFNEHSENYGKILRTVPVEGPGAAGNEAHHCHLSADKNYLLCGGLLSVLYGAPDIFVFDVHNARHPKYVGSLFTTAKIVDDFLPLPGGGFLVTNMGGPGGGAPGALSELDANHELIATYPNQPSLDGSDISTFNPHGIDADFGTNELVTADLVNPVTTLNLWTGPIELRSALRFWDLDTRRLRRSVFIQNDNGGTMDVKLIPGDPHGRAITASMFTGLVYSVDPTDGSYVQAFDCENIVPHVEVPVPGGMTQLLAMPKSGKRIMFSSFQAGQVGMLDITNPLAFTEVNVVSFGLGAGPHEIVLSDDDKRLVVTDYFLNEDDFGKLHFEGDHVLHVLHVSDDGLSFDTKFPPIDFNTAFGTPMRPHGVQMK